MQCEVLTVNLLIRWGSSIGEHHSSIRLQRQINCIGNIIINTEAQNICIGYIVTVTEAYNKIVSVTSLQLLRLNKKCIGSIVTAAKGAAAIKHQLRRSCYGSIKQEKSSSHGKRSHRRSSHGSNSHAAAAMGARATPQYSYGSSSSGSSVEQ